MVGTLMEIVAATHLQIRLLETVARLAGHFFGSALNSITTGEKSTSNLSVLTEVGLPVWSKEIRSTFPS